jgi:hypothetical protein
MFSSRQNQAAHSQPVKVFQFVAQALEAETLQGQTATRVVNSVKNLVQATNVNLQQVVAGLTPEQQRVVQAYFS